MKLNRSFSRRLDAILKTHIAESDRIIVVVVDAGQRAVLSKVVVRRIPHLGDRIVCVTDAAINLVLIIFPEAFVGLPAELAGRIILARPDGSVEKRIEIVVDLLEQR